MSCNADICCIPTCIGNIEIYIFDFLFLDTSDVLCEGREVIDLSEYTKDHECMIVVKVTSISWYSIKFC